MRLICYLISLSRLIARAVWGQPLLFLVPIGGLARYDYLLRAAYCNGEGGELRLDVA
jgi:hypothetical protein